jgi:hypothetical protein
VLRAEKQHVASVHKCLRIGDLCKELAFGAHRANRLIRNSHNRFEFNGLCRQFLESRGRETRLAPSCPSQGSWVVMWLRVLKRGLSGLRDEFDEFELGQPNSNNEIYPVRPPMFAGRTLRQAGGKTRFIRFGGTLRLRGNGKNEIYPGQRRETRLTTGEPNSHAVPCAGPRAKWLFSVSEAGGKGGDCSGSTLGRGIWSIAGSEQSKLGAIEERKAEFAVLITSLRVSHEIIPQDRFAVRL